MLRRRASRRMVLLGLVVFSIAVYALDLAPYTLSTIDVPGAGRTAASGTNNDGQIVGFFKSASDPQRGFLLDRGTFTTIEFPGAGITSAHGINNSGQIVGICGFPGEPRPHGFVLYHGTFFVLDAPVAEATATSPYKINDRLQIVGTYSVGSPPIVHGFLFDLLGHGTFFTTIDVPGAVTTSAYGINNFGQIVGLYETADASTHGFLFDNGIFTTIDVGQAGHITPADVNDRGEIVGFEDNSGVLGVPQHPGH